MQSIISFITSVFLLFTSQVKSIFPEFKKPTPTPTVIIIATPTNSPSPTPTPTPTTRPIPTQVSIKTPTNTLAKDGTYEYVITIRPGEQIRLTTIIPMKGSTTLSIELPSSGAPAGVYLSQDTSNDRNIFLHVDSSATPGYYHWRQAFTATYSSGVAPGNLSMGIQLTILPAL